MSENREYKSDVFSMLMQYPENALQVFNALNGTNYTDPGVVEMCTLAKGISLSVRNDASFIIDMDLSIYEHQSTYNPNMPLRSLIYLGDVIRPLIKGRDLYGSKRVMIPTPHMVVFYNGTKDCPEREVQRLSDSYVHDGEPEVELICVMYNINSGNNEDFLSECSVLREYMCFVNKVRENEDAERETPVEDAIDWCVENDVLREFLLERKDEVVKAMTIDMTFEAREEIIRKEEREQGREEGRAEGRAEGKAEGKAEGGREMLVTLVKNLLSDGRTPEEAAAILHYPIEEVMKIAQM